MPSEIQLRLCLKTTRWIFYSGGSSIILERILQTPVFDLGSCPFPGVSSCCLCGSRSLSRCSSYNFTLVWMFMKTKVPALISESEMSSAGVLNLSRLQWRSTSWPQTAPQAFRWTPRSLIVSEIELFSRLADEVTRKWRPQMGVNRVKSSRSAVCPLERQKTLQQWKRQSLWHSASPLTCRNKKKQLPAILIAFLAFD